MSTPLTRPVRGRAMHLRIAPQPSSLAQSRGILRLLSRFGEVEYYRNLKYDALTHPHAALVIFRDEAAASAFHKQCPLNIRMDRGSGTAEVENLQEERGEDASIGLSRSTGTAASGTNFVAGYPGQSQIHQTSAAAPRAVARPSFTSQTTRTLSTSASSAAPQKSKMKRKSILENLPTPPTRPLPMPLLSQSPTIPLSSTPRSNDTQSFKIYAGPARARFRDQADMGHYHGAFELDTKSAAQQDLIKRVPIPGLSCVDWRAPPKPWRRMEWEREKTRDGQCRLGLLAAESHDTGRASKP